ncbi:MAG TPA: tetratricopeptide repeat protein [Burkholderiales bacterium]|nr:tetratricopeptide repeat protein [Burkholderiales bacterium]
MKWRDVAALPLVLALGMIAPVAAADELHDAETLFKQGNNAEALDKVNSYLANHSNDVKARFLLGLIYTEQHKSAEAIKVFTALTQEHPELPEPYNNLAVLYAAQGQYDKARIALETAIRDRPNYAVAYENLGDVYAKLAAQAYDKALEFDKTNTTAQTKRERIKDLLSADTQATKATANFAAGGASSDTQEILNTVNGWAEAWSKGDVAAYLAYYAQDFKTPDGEDRQDWENSRKQSISKSQPIQVAIVDPKITISDATHASASFTENYRSKNLNTSNTKILHLVKSGDRWLIQTEQTRQ